MSRVFKFATWLCAALVLVSAAATNSFGQAAARLSQVKRLYVDSLGTTVDFCDAPRVKKRKRDFLAVMAKRRFLRMVWSTFFGSEVVCDYEAMLKSSLGFMFSHGFRARSQPGHHIAIIDFVRSRIDKKHAGLMVVFDRLRRKRNTALYDDTGFVSHHDAEQALESAGDYLNAIRVDIAARKP